MKNLLCFAVLIATAAVASRAEEPEAAPKIHAQWFLSPDHRTVVLSVWNTGGKEVAVAPGLTIVRIGPDAAGDAAREKQKDSDTIQAIMELPVKAGQGGEKPVAGGSREMAPVKVAPGESKRIVYTLDDNTAAAVGAAGVVTYSVKYHGRLLDLMAYDGKGQIVKRFEGDRNIVTTYAYDDTGKRNGQQISLPDDPELRAALATKEKALLQRLQDAGNNQQMRDDVLHDMVIFYTSRSLEFDKAASLQFALRNPDEIYNLKLFLALNSSKSYKEMNEKLEELAQMFPAKKAYTEHLMLK